VYSNLFSPESIEELTAALQTQFLSAIWETFYVTLLSTAFAIVIGLPLGVLLVVGERDGVLPLPRWLMSVLNVLINLGGVKDEAKAAFFSEEGKKLVARADEIAQRIQDTVNHDIMG